MKRLGVVIGILILLIIGGGLTSRMQSTGRAGFVPSTIEQTDSPEGSVFEAVPWQAEQFFLLSGFMLFNLVGMGVTIGIVMWFLSRQVKSSQAEAEESASKVPAES